MKRVFENQTKQIKAHRIIEMRIVYGNFRMVIK